MHNNTNPIHSSPRAGTWLLGTLAAAMLAACGGGHTQGDAAATPEAALSFALVADEAPALDPALQAEPSFHVAPVLLAEPADADAADNTASALTQPSVQALAAGIADLPTRGLTVQAIEQAQRSRVLSAGVGNGNGEGGIGALAASGSVTTYTPAQIRAAYGLPALPAAGTPVSAIPAAQAAQLGAGQTIYIVDARHDPNVAAELDAFNKKFGLPGCTTRAIAATAALPLAAATTADGCVLSVVYATAASKLTATAPAYDAGWATEIALDVQWAHATAPLARIVLIEAVDATLNSLIGAIKLANAMGPGAVSMSFGGSEGNWTASVDAAFSGSGMSYFAATGDAGAQVSWPAVSPLVLAVGGTRLNYSGSGARSESGWSMTGGGISAYTVTPAYQSKGVPGIGSLPRRGVADVAFNADPGTGQYLAVMTPGSSTVSWLSAGGTSLSTPQWAGLVAVANAMRAQGGKAALGTPHSALYGQIGAVPGSYAASFADVSSGSDGSCATCSAKAGYDMLTGLGTPNVASLLTALSGATTTATPAPVPTPTPAPTPAAQPPVITAAALTGVVGKALSGSFSVTDPAGYAMTVTISGTQPGMAFSASGNTIKLAWTPSATGNYALPIVAIDSAGLKSQATLAITVNAK